MWETFDAKSFADACLVELKKPVITPGGRAGDDRSTGSRSNGTNWVERSPRGRLPRYIRIVRNGLMREGHSEGRATALAVAAMKRWARGGDNVRPAVQRAAAAALAEWEAMKAGKSDDIEPEEKVVRHVRTPAGVRRYNPPIGSIIVADRKLRNLTGLDSIYDGWDRAKGSDGKEYSPSAGSAANSDSGGSGTAPAGKPRKPSGEAKPKPEEARTRRTRVVGIEKGDTLTELAKRYNTTVRHLMRLNPKIKNPDVIYAGDDIRVPRKNRRQRRRLPNSLGHVVATMPKKKPAESAKE